MGKNTFQDNLTVNGTLIATGNVTFDTNTLFVDAANNRVGIGTTSPSYPLTIVGTGTGAAGRTFAQIQNTQTDSGAGILLTNGNSRSAAFQYTGSAYSLGEAFTINTAGDYPVVFMTNGGTSSGGTSYISFSPGGFNNESVRFFGTKNVSINTTTDAGFRLDVNGTARVGTGSPTTFFNRGFTVSGTSGDIAAGIFNSDTSTGTAGFILGQSNTVFSSFLKYGSTYSGNFVGSSIPIANSSQFQAGPNNNLPMLFQGTPLIFNCGITGTNTAVRLSSGSLHITTLSNAHIDGSFPLDVNGTSRFQNDITISDTRNIILNTTTGTKIGTATGQKLGFWNAAPIAQPTTAVAAATLVGGGGTNLTDTDTFDGYTLQQVVKALRNAGLLA